HSPGHVFPLRACSGGVLEREGHTEATVDLMKLAGLGDCGVLCELTNPDGTMARLPEVVEYAEKHGMPVITIEDLKAYRTQRESRQAA
uniref:3,4-dihydroxy-2-butanone-4-phosphate synthase n=1 Tax=Salidesulfovibrio brasiliensis TaxID=221711 RepID=UPI000B3371FC